MQMYEVSVGHGSHETCLSSIQNLVVFPAVMCDAITDRGHTFLRLDDYTQKGRPGESSNHTGRPCLA
jgi:hypothetical protein